VLRQELGDGHADAADDRAQQRSGGGESVGDGAL
jgi:hypothetical protein